MTLIDVCIFEMVYLTDVFHIYYYEMIVIAVVFVFKLYFHINTAHSLFKFVLNDLVLRSLLFNILNMFFKQVNVQLM